MNKWKAGDILQHKLTHRLVIVMSTCSDGITVCRACDEAGIYTTYNFYPEELQDYIEVEKQTGFTKEE